MGRMEFDVRDLIMRPYRHCRSCGCETLGLMSVGPSSVHRRCATCLESASSPLPEIVKKVVYLDQFAVSDMMKTLDPASPSHGRVPERWLDLFSLVDRLVKLQLIVCPDSEAHRDESSLHPETAKLRRLYEHLSTGVSFLPFEQIRDRQVHALFESWVDGAAPPATAHDAARVSRPDLHGWTDVMRVSVDLGLDFSADIVRGRDQTADAMAPIYERWGTERLAYSDIQQRELRGFSEAVVAAYRQWATRMSAAEAGILLPDYESLVPGSLVRLVDSLMRSLGARGVVDGERMSTVLRFFAETDLSAVPVVHITSHLWASVARDVGAGARPPETSVFSDFRVISSLLPYCDAMLLDRACVGMLRNNPLRGIVEGHGCEVFSPRDFDAYMDYLRGIEANADPAHLSLVSEVYGPDWPTPFTTIFTYEAEGPNAPPS
jgi:hypothetical protein